MNYTKGILTLVALLTVSTSVAMADGNAFTPLNFDDTTVKPATPVSKTTAPANAVKAPNSVDVTTGEIPIGNDNIQNAILELDNAQVGIRNDLLEYKAKYADVDAQFKLVKNERSMLAKQVKSIERRIKNIDKAKEKIRKNMI